MYAPKLIADVDGVSFSRAGSVINHPPIVGELVVYVHARVVLAAVSPSSEVNVEEGVFRVRTYTIYSIPPESETKGSAIVSDTYAPLRDVFDLIGEAVHC